MLLRCCAAILGLAGAAEAHGEMNYPPSTRQVPAGKGYPGTLMTDDAAAIVVAAPGAPEQLKLSVAGNPATSMVVSWISKVRC